MVKPDDLVTQTAAAAALGISRQMVWSLVARGKVAGYGRDRLVSLGELREYRKGQDKGGRPRKPPGRR